jgi:hypothetical protein
MLDQHRHQVAALEMRLEALLHPEADAGPGQQAIAGFGKTGAAGGGRTSATPIAASSFLIVWLTAERVTPRRSAARPASPSISPAMSTRSSSVRPPPHEGRPNSAQDFGTPCPSRRHSLSPGGRRIA